MGKVALPLAVILLVLPVLAAPPAQAASTRTWVSGITTADDMNPCSRTSPCKTFAGAVAKTAPGGEINCLDPGDFGKTTPVAPGDFGRVTITFSVTISCEAGTAGILAPDGAVGVEINADPADVVTLRGLDIDGQGSGGAGIQILSAKAVHIEKTAIRNFRTGSTPATGITSGLASVTIFLFIADTVISDNAYGILLRSGVGGSGFKIASLKNATITGSTNDGLFLADNTYTNITESIISGNGDSAVHLYNASGATTNIDRSTIANNGTGLNAGSGSTIRISGNNIYNNTTGILIANGGTVQSDGTNKHGNSNGGAQVPNASFAEF